MPHSLRLYIPFLVKPFWASSAHDSESPISQLSPENASSQSQVYPLKRSVQVPPLMQGLDSHSSISAMKKIELEVKVEKCYFLICCNIIICSRCNDLCNCKALQWHNGFDSHSSISHSTKKPVTTMLTYPWKCTVLHCNHLGNTWKPLVC